MSESIEQLKKQRDGFAKVRIFNYVVDVIAVGSIVVLFVAHPLLLQLKGMLVMTAELFVIIGAFVWKIESSIATYDRALTAVEGEEPVMQEVEWPVGSGKKSQSQVWLNSENKPVAIQTGGKVSLYRKTRGLARVMPVLAIYGIMAVVGVAVYILVPGR